MRNIRLCDDRDVAAMLAIVNDAAVAYRGVIPADRWHDPYMPEAELRSEIAAGVEFWGLETDKGLIGVMGVQPVRDVDLIRHAYVRSDSSATWRRRGTDRAPAPTRHTTHARRHLGRRKLGDRLLSASRLRVGRAAARECAAQNLLDDPGAADRHIGGAGHGRRKVSHSSRCHSRLFACVHPNMGISADSASPADRVLAAREAAAVLGTTVDVVKQRAHRAYQSLKSALNTAGWSEYGNPV